MNTLHTFPASPLSGAFDEMFDRLMGQVGEAAQQSRQIPIDVSEDGDLLTVRATIPGVSPKDLSVQVEGNVLTIRGERRPEPVSEKAKVYRRETAYGTFVRSLRLGDRLDSESVRADAKDGVLTITIARIPEEKPRQIQVNVLSSEATSSLPTETA